MKTDFISKRSTLLDSIRATAIIMVLVFHVATRYPAEQLDPVARLFLKYGFLGVDVFFPLSGYLITRFLIERGVQGQIRTFFLRRFFRIVPLYVVAVTVFALATLFVVREDGDLAIIDRIWVTYTFLTGWFAFAWGPDSVPYTITWSLSVEEFAYILFGLLAWVLRSRFVYCLIFFAIAPVLLRYYLNLQGHEHIYYFPLARLDSIAVGGLVAVLLPRLRSLLLWVGLLLIVSYLFRQMGGAVGKTALYSLVTFGTCFFIVLFETVFRSSRNALVVFYARIGFYSYFTYLFHFFNLHLLLMLAGRFLADPVPFWIMSLACLALTTVQAIISFRIFEGPCLAFGRRLERAPQPQSTEVRTG